jgi:acyl-CoA-binding protein
VFENRVLRRIFGPNRNKMKGSLRKLNNEELQNLYSSPSQGQDGQGIQNRRGIIDLNMRFYWVPIVKETTRET